MKKLKYILCLLTIIVIFPAFTLSVQASEVSDRYLSEFEKILPDGYSNVTEDADLFDSLLGPEAVMGEIISAALGRRGELLSFLLLLISATAIFAVASRVSGGLSEAVGVGVSVVICSCIVLRLTPIFVEVGESLSRLADFFALFVPIATALQYSSGAVRTASASAMGMNVTVSILSRLGVPFFVSLAGFGLAIATLSALGDESVGNLSRSVKSFFGWSIGLICALIMGALSLQTFIASARDSAAMRAAKYAASSLIPVVGGTVSGAMATLATGLSYAKSVIGVGAVSVIIALFLSPLLMLLLYRTALSVMSGVCSYLGVARGERCFGALRSAFDLFVAVYSISVIICIFEIAVFLMCGVTEI